MPKVFISYRQTNDAERERVRVWAERLRACGVDVILDQFYLTEHPGGPAEGWPKWSSDGATQTERVLIIGTAEWFQCFDCAQKPGTGLGAACEAYDLRQRIYDGANLNETSRVVLFDDADAVHISHKLKGYHRFHAERDFRNIVRWLGGIAPASGTQMNPTSETIIPHNLPHLQPFFGREEELQKIAEALRPDNRTWGALIDGPGGIGKTSLAVRAAYDASPVEFRRIVFVSLKTRELDDDGVRDLSGFILSGLVELFNEVARQLGCDEITKVQEDQRPRLLLDALASTQTLLVLDNLESLLKKERDTVFTFVKKLPAGCKAILTSRGRIGSGAEELILERLNQEAILDTLAELATHNPLLAATSEAERIVLYTQTSGNPLLLRWTAGQLGRGHCRSFSDALDFLRSCPEDNDPLEFIFGDLVEEFTSAEIKVLSALTYFTLPAKVEHVAAVAGLPAGGTSLALRSLANRSLATPNDELRTFTLVPMVADFLRRKKPDTVAETGDRLEQRAYALVLQNGYSKHDRFPVLDADWPTVAAALPQFLTGPNVRLQTVCVALRDFLNFTGRWDECAALSREAEAKAVTVGDFASAGWRAYALGMIHFQRGQSAEALSCTDRAEAHWREAQVGTREKATILRLRAMGYELAKDYPSAIVACREAIKLWQTLGRDTEEVALGFGDLADTEHISGDLNAAERDYREALRIAQAGNFRECVAIYTGDLASIALDREDWPAAEALAREALLLAERLGRQELIAGDCFYLARAFMRQGKAAAARPHAQRAVDIFIQLGSPSLEAARRTLGQCEG